MLAIVALFVKSKEEFIIFVSQMLEKSITPCPTMPVEMSREHQGLAAEINGFHVLAVSCPSNVGQDTAKTRSTLISGNKGPLMGEALGLSDPWLLPSSGLYNCITLGWVGSIPKDTVFSWLYVQSIFILDGRQIEGCASNRMLIPIELH